MKVVSQYMITFRSIEDFCFGFESVKRGTLMAECGIAWVLYCGFFDIARIA